MTPWSRALCLCATLTLSVAAGAACSSAPDDASSADDNLSSSDLIDATDISFDDPSVPVDPKDTSVSKTLSSSTIPAPAPGAPDSDDHDDENETHPASTLEHDGDIAANGSLGLPPADSHRAMKFHHGAVMEQQNVYFIYYGDWAVGTRKLLHTFIDGLQHQDLDHDYLGGLTYADGHGRRALGKGVKFGGAYAVGRPYGHHLNDDHIFKIVRSLIASKRAPIDENGLFLVLPSADVSVAGQSRFCGWHASGYMTFRRPSPPPVVHPDAGSRVVDAGARVDAGSTNGEGADVDASAESSTDDAGVPGSVEDAGDVASDVDPLDGTTVNAPVGRHIAVAPSAQSPNETVDIKYGVILNPKLLNCSQFGTAKSHLRTPNNNFVADSMVSVVSHEMMEAATDPDSWEGWFDIYHDDISEIGDKCAWYFTNARKVKGALANLFDRRSKRWWLVQSEFMNNRACALGAHR